MPQAAEDVEAQCDAIAQQGPFLQPHGPSTWPDGTVAARYGFIHALYQEVLYARIPAGRRTRLHHQIGARQEIAYGAHAREIAAELATHFERGQDLQRAVQYLLYAGENAERRSAHQEMTTSLTKGLRLLFIRPDTPERAQQELALQMTLARALMASKGYAASEVEQTFNRAHELCQQVEDAPQLFRVLRGLYVFYLVRAKHQTAHELGEQLLSLAQGQQEALYPLEAHGALGQTLFFLGAFAAAHEHLNHCMVFYDPRQGYTLHPRQGADLVANLSDSSWVLWMLGYPDQALQRNHEALTLAPELMHPLTRL